MDESRAISVEAPEYAAPGFHRPGIRSWCGWVFLLALIALASNMVDPSYLDPAHKNFIFIIINEFYYFTFRICREYWSWTQF